MLSNAAAWTPDHTLHRTRTRTRTLKHVGETNLTPDFILISGRAPSVLPADVGSWRCVHRCHLWPEKQANKEIGSVGMSPSLNNTGNCVWNLDYANAKTLRYRKKTCAVRVASYQQSHKPKHVENQPQAETFTWTWRSRLKGREKFPWKGFNQMLSVLFKYPFCSFV